MRALAALLLVVAALLRAPAVVAAETARPPTSIDAVLGSLGGQPAIQAGPGLGSSKEEPSGEPVVLVLPTGYTLERVRGDSGDVPAPGGAFDVALVLSFDPTSFEGQSSNRFACADEPVRGGWLLWSEDDEAQSIWSPIATCRTATGARTPVLDLPVPANGPGTLAVSVGGYCVNLDREPPDPEYTYLTGVISDDPGLLQILDAVAGKNLQDFGNISTIQDVIWDYTDFEGLTPESLARLAGLT